MRLQPQKTYDVVCSHRSSPSPLRRGKGRGLPSAKAQDEGQNLIAAWRMWQPLTLTLSPSL
jgi:hypothetical protein